MGLAAHVELARVAAPGPSPRQLPRGVYGALELEQRGSLLVIHAWAPRATHAIDARVDLRAPGVTAEVIAVRAVETLRAAMLAFAKIEQGAVPEVVRGFTRFEPEPHAPPVAIARPERPLSSLAPPLAFWAGPALSLHAGTSPDLGAQLGVLVGPSFGFVAAALETNVSDLRLEAAHGSASASRRAVWAQLGARFRPGRSWEVTTRGGVGYAVFDVTGEGEAGYHGSSTTHGSLALMLALSSAYWATRSFGLYGSVGFRLATDAPTILIARREVITLDRPSFVVSVGATVGVF